MQLYSSIYNLFLVIMYGFCTEYDLVLFGIGFYIWLNFLLYVILCWTVLSFQFCSCIVVAQLLTLIWHCNPMDCSMTGFPVLHYLPELVQAHVHWVGDAIQPSYTFSSSVCLQSFLASGSFPMSRLFVSGGQCIGASASESVLPMNIQGWFHLGLIGLISLLSKRLSRIFSSFIIWTPQFFSLLYDPTITSGHGYWKKYSFD